MTYYHYIAYYDGLLRFSGCTPEEAKNHAMTWLRWCSG